MQASSHLRRHTVRLLNNTKVRFILTGVINTGIDFAILNILIIATPLPVVVANIISTSIAMCVSYTLNQKMVFKVEGRLLSHQFLMFLAVTLFGLWVVQGLAIHFGVQALHHFSFPDWINNNIAKVVATVLSTIWNYIWYSRLVFVDRSSAKTVRSEK